MPAIKTATKRTSLGAFCHFQRRSFPIAISDITSDGCSAEADCEWDDDGEFLHLTIADEVEINGRILWHRGHRAGIGFYGQIHPHIIEHWNQPAA